ncbi:MAG: DUF2071 domain-containing protein [Proteobacteria bacterium]|nr:DUF2071 domain-containing protein [Pseudomonadota bacterium]
MASAAHDRNLERALIFNFLIHGVALLFMVVFLIAALPGGSSAPDLQRVAVIAEHPWRFRIGWLPWQLCAVADLWLAIAMVRVRWIPRIPTVVVLVLTIAAVIPDQYAQAVWITRGVELAATDPTAYLTLERAIFPLTAGWGALFYTLAALGWTWSFARAGTWTRLLTILSIPLWSTMLVAVVSPLLPADVRPSPLFVSTANGLGFIQLQLWLALVTEQVLRRARPAEPHGRLAPWRYPGRRPVAWLVDRFANSRLWGAILEPLPELRMRSDIADVVYVNYLIDAAVARTLIPPALELQRLGPDGQYALFTFLTYRHGHFGPALLGPLRRLCPSPVQTNWRLHVVDPHTGHRGIYFVTNAITSTPLALAARMLSEGMPMHVLHRGELAPDADGTLRGALEPGTGSAPDAALALRPAPTAPVLAGAWAACFDDYRAFLAYCVPQDRAMSSQPLHARISRQEIELGIPLDACVPLDGTVTSRAAGAIVGDRAPLCFHVARVRFTFTAERHDRRPG